MTNENLIDKDFIHSDDFIDIIQTVVHKITLRQAGQKAEFFANLSVANMLRARPRCSLDWQCRFIEIIANLNESEMRLLKALNEHRSPEDASVSGVSTPFGLEKAEFELCFDSLLSQAFETASRSSRFTNDYDGGKIQRKRRRSRCSN